jgi:hypothetical protein
MNVNICNAFVGVEKGVDIFVLGLILGISGELCGSRVAFASVFFICLHIVLLVYGAHDTCVTEGVVLQNLKM